MKVLARIGIEILVYAIFIYDLATIYHALNGLYIEKANFATCYPMSCQSLTHYPHQDVTCASGRTGYLNKVYQHLFVRCCSSNYDVCYQAGLLRSYATDWVAYWT